MSWDYRVDKNGNLEIIVSRWYTKGKGKRIVSLVAPGFEPHEAVQVEICGKEQEGLDGHK